MRIFEILDEPEEELLNEQDVPLPEPILGSVEFENVSFSYDPEKPLIRNLNFKVDDAGQMVAIVGPTGAGKTTLINLLMRFYDVTKAPLKLMVLTQKMNRSDVPICIWNGIARCLVV